MAKAANGTIRFNANLRKDMDRKKGYVYAKGESGCSSVNTHVMNEVYLLRPGCEIF
jgi:hypothetical protein